MRMRIITAFMAVIAVLSVSSVASADVPRCQGTVDDPSQAVTATFSVYHPRAAFTQWENTWQHDFTVSLVPATGQFSGDGYEYNAQEPFSTATAAHETVKGTYNAATKEISFEIGQDTAARSPSSRQSRSGTPARCRHSRQCRWCGSQSCEPCR